MIHAKAIIAGAVVLGLIFSHGMAWRYGAKLEASANHALRAQEAVEYSIAIQGAYKRKAETEAKWQAKVSEIDQARQRLKDNNETQRLADLAALESRTLILRDPNSKAGGNCAASVASGSSGSNGGEGAELPAKTSGFLLSLASEADAIVIQLSACQGILEAERR